MSFSSTAIFKDKKWFCRNVCICMFKWDLIYMMPSTITDNYVVFEIKLWLKNVCGICSTPIKICLRKLSFFSTNPAKIQELCKPIYIFPFAWICSYHSTFEYQFLIIFHAVIIIIIPIIMEAYTYRALIRYQTMCQVFYVNYPFILH